jgi:GTP-binding protein HflX
MLDVNQPIRFLPVHVINPQANKEKALHTAEELESLIATFGGEIVDRIIQRRENPDKATYIGKGKVQEVLEKVKNGNVNVVVLNAMAKPGQVFALKKALEIVNPQIDVWDRVDLILHIFDKHATTTEAKLQIELARMRYMGPRIYGMGFVLSRQGGGIGTSGIGETNTELMRRHWRNEMKKITDQLEKVKKERELQLERRKKAGLQTVSIVGYTNAGKSALFNLLTGKHILVENALFATLDSTVGKMYMQQLQKEVLLTDTIGFIRNLPPRLINAFQSTLMESLHADVLLHVIDISDPEVDGKIFVVNDILKELGRKSENVLYVFNKIDAVSSFPKEALQERYGENEILFISVKTGVGIAQLQEAIANRLR